MTIELRQRPRRWHDATTLWWFRARVMRVGDVVGEVEVTEQFVATAHLALGDQLVAGYGAAVLFGHGLATRFELGRVLAVERVADALIVAGVACVEPQPGQPVSVETFTADGAALGSPLVGPGRAVLAVPEVSLLDGLQRPAVPHARVLEVGPVAEVERARIVAEDREVGSWSSSPPSSTGGGAPVADVAPARRPMTTSDGWRGARRRLGVVA